MTHGVHVDLGKLDAPAGSLGEWEGGGTKY